MQVYIEVKKKTSNPSLEFFYVFLCGKSSPIDTHTVQIYFVWVNRFTKSVLFVIYREKMTRRLCIFLQRYVFDRSQNGYEKNCWFVEAPLQASLKAARH